MNEYLKQAIEIVKAQASVKVMTVNEITLLLQELTKNLRDIAETTTDSTPAKLNSDIDPKKAIKERSVNCLECGKQFIMLTKKHLAYHDLTPEAYREKWGYPKKAALVSKSLARARKVKMQEMQLWTRKKYITQQNVNI